MHRVVLLAALLAATTFAVSCKKAPTETAGLTPTTLAPEAKLAADLQLFARAKPMDADDAAKKGAELKKGNAAVEGYVDALLADGLGGRFARELVVSPGSPFRDRHPLHISYTLKTTKSDGKTIYHIREACTAKEAVEVVPWWDTDPVLVCPSSYKPEVKGDKEGRTCGASMLDIRESDVCGCGPMLVYCLKDKEQRDQFKGLLVQEVTDTAEHVVDKDLPIEDLFTMNETVGNFATEYLYRRARVVSGEDPKKLFPIEGFSSPKLSKRFEPQPGFHAGVLSSPVMTFSSDALRGVMRNYYESLWCTGVSRSSVETEQVLALKKVDLRIGDGWKELASMPICTDCHARLDYGMQFFWGYPSSTMGVDFNLMNARTGKGHFYGNDIKDDRGEADLTPRGFGLMATTQPEFSSCMTHKIVDHVFNGTATTEDYEAVRDVFKQGHKIKPTLRAALVRYATRELASPTPAGDVVVNKPALDGPPPPVHANLPAGSDAIAVSPKLQKLLRQHCKECHDTDDRLPLMGETLTQKQMSYVLDRVAFGAMPKDTDEIDEAIRRHFIDETTTALFANATDRSTASSYYVELMRATPVHRFANQLTVINDVADGKKFRPSGTENTVSSSLLGLSPSFAVNQGITALKNCSAKKDPAAKEKCLVEASNPALIIAGQP